MSAALHPTDVGPLGADHIRQRLLGNALLQPGSGQYRDDFLPILGNGTIIHHGPHLLLLSDVIIDDNKSQPWRRFAQTILNHRQKMTS